MKKIALLLCAAIMCSMVCGCSEKTANKGETTALSWYVRPTAQSDLQLVQEEANKIIRDKINAELEIVRIDPAAYSQKIKTALASGEKFDMMYMSNSYGYFDFASKGALLSLNNLLPEYAPKTYESVPEKFWDATKVNNNIYGAINYQIVARQYGFYLRKDLAEKYAVNPDEIKNFEDIEPFLKAVKNGEGKDITPLGVIRGGYWSTVATYAYGIEYIGAGSQPGAIYSDSDDYKVIDQYQSDEFKKHLGIMRDFYKKGYIKRDAPTIDNQRDFLATGKVACIWNPIKPGGMDEVKQMCGGVDYICIEISEPFTTTNTTIATLTSINAISDNPEKATQLIELLNTDKELYNTLCYGIEGKHYNKISENRIEQISNSGYSPNVSWMFGNNFNAYLLPSQEDSVWDETKRLNETSSVSKIMGFNFDQLPVKNEMAQCSTVLDEYLPSLVTGAVDYEDVLPEFIAKLKLAGSEKIIAEKQRQLDEWLKTKK